MTCISKRTLKVVQKKFKCFQNSTEVFFSLCKKKSCVFLLELFNNKIKQLRKSFIVIDSALRISAISNIVIVTSLTENGDSLLYLLDKVVPKSIKIKKFINCRKFYFSKCNNNLDEDSKLLSFSVFDCLRFLILTLNILDDACKSIFFGGFFSYDLVNSFEELPKLYSNNHCPDYCFYLAETLLTINYKKKYSILQISIFSDQKSEKLRLYNRFYVLQDILKKSLKKYFIFSLSFRKIVFNKSDIEYQKNIMYLQKLINQGEIFQIVPSRKYFLSCSNPLNSYDKLKHINPSPYMFFMKDYQFILFGSSPERSLKFNSKDKVIEISPIAGTRVRGFQKNGSIDLDLDSKIELDMKTNSKELSEHLMLVDLARSDLSKVCKVNSRFIINLLKVVRYSFVMHIISRISGILRSDLDAFYAYRACMNMGTLTGAPKFKAMYLISKIEKERRGIYGGSIGYFNNSGFFNTCIIIRSAYIENDIAGVQVGAGIVLESFPENEVKETKNKVQGIIKSIYDSYII